MALKVNDLHTYCYQHSQCSRLSLCELCSGWSEVQWDSFYDHTSSWYARMRDSGSWKDSVQDPVDKKLVASLIHMRARDDVDVNLDLLVNSDDALPVDIFGSEEDESVVRQSEHPYHSKSLSKSTKSTNSTKESTKSTNSTKGSTNNSKDAKKSTNSTKESTKSTNESRDGKKSTNSTKESTKSTNESRDSTKSSKSDKKSTNSTKESTKSTKEPRDGKKSTNSTKESTKSTKESRDSTKLSKNERKSTNSTKESTNVSRDSSRSDKKSTNSTNVGPDVYGTPTKSTKSTNKHKEDSRNIRESTNSTNITTTVDSPPPTVRDSGILMSGVQDNQAETDLDYEEEPSDEDHNSSAYIPPRQALAYSEILAESVGFQLASGYEYPTMGNRSTLALPELHMEGDVEVNEVVNEQTKMRYQIIGRNKIYCSQILLTRSLCLANTELVLLQ